MFSRQRGKCFFTIPGQTHPRCPAQGQNPSEQQSQEQPVAAAAPCTLGGGMCVSCPISAAAGKSPKSPEEDERGLNLGSGLEGSAILANCQPCGVVTTLSVAATALGH